MMLTNALRFCGQAGAPLLALKRINEPVDWATADVAALDAEALRQPTGTTPVTRTRTK
jgi:hypothetical protein